MTRFFRTFVDGLYLGLFRPKLGFVSRISALTLAFALFASICMPIFEHSAYSQQQFVQPPQNLVLILPFSISAPADGTVTNDNTPAIEGTKPADSSSIGIYDGNGVHIGTAKSDTSFWSFTPASSLTDGTHTITAYLLNGCEFNCQEDSITITIDTVLPKPPAITQPPDKNVTNNNLPIFAGYTESGSAKVEIFDDGTKLGEATSVSYCNVNYNSDSIYYAASVYAPSTFNWCFIPPSALSEGVHEITATATDGASNVSPESNIVEVTIDTTPPQTVASPPGGAYALQQSITLLSNEPGVIYYTLDGTMPTSTSSIYDGPIILDNPLALSFFAVDMAGNSEAVKSESYAVSADEEGPDGRVRINSGDLYTEDPTVDIELLCDDPGSGCKSITLEWDNEDLNVRSTAIDSVQDLSVSTAAGSRYAFTAFETGPNTGTFSLTFSNDDSDENYLGFEDGEEIDVMDVQLSTEQGIKWVRALFEDQAGNTSWDEDSIELRAGGQPGTDTVPPVISEPMPLVEEATGSLTFLSLQPPKLTDNMDPSPKLTSNSPANGFPYGTTVVTWTATDSAGNTASAVQEVTIVEVFIDSISDSTPYWEQDFVFVSGTTEGSESGGFAVAVDWGDGALSEGITITSSGDWGPVRHSYSVDSMRIAPDREIVAKLVESGDDTRATSAPASVVIQKHPTRITLLPDASSDNVAGQLIDTLTESGLPDKTIKFSSTGGASSILPATTMEDGSFTTDVEMLSSGSMAEAEFAGDELYLASSTDSDLTISVNTDKEEYRQGDEIVATGKISQIIDGEAVTVRLIGIDGSVLKEAHEPIMPDQTYSSRFELTSESSAGRHRIEALYAGQQADTTFIYGGINRAPVADAGPDITIDPTSEGLTVFQLDGTKSADPDGDELSYRWDQVSGPRVELQNADSPIPSFVLPKVDAATEVIFQLRVTDGLTSDTKTVKASILPTVAPPSEGNATIYYLAGGGAAAAVAGSTLGFKYFKPKRPKAPILRWHVYAPHTIQEGGTAYIDVIVNNLGEADGKNIKLAIESTELECDPGTTIETLMPLESRKFSFKVKQRVKDSPTGSNTYRIKLSLESTWSAKKELLPLLTSSEIKWNPRQEKTLQITSRTIRVGLLVPENIKSYGGSEHLTIHSWLQGRGFHSEILSYSQSALIDPSNYDALAVFPAEGLIPFGLVPALHKLVAAGKGFVVIGRLKHDTMPAEGEMVGPEGRMTHQNSIFHLLGYGYSFNNKMYDPVNTMVKQGLGLRIVDSEHPITRTLEIGNVYRSIGSGETVTSVPVNSGQILAEQGIIQGGGQNDILSLSSVPAIVANSLGSDSRIATTDGRSVHFNFGVNPHFGMSSQLFEKSLMWVSHSIAEEIKEEQ